jgi:hypothetical protein
MGDSAQVERWTRTTRNTRRRGAFTTAVVGLGIGALLVSACGSPKPAPPKTAAAVSTRCPDLSKTDEIGAFDFAKEYQLSRDAADKLKAAALASMEIGVLADRLDADLGIACAQLAHDLGNKGDWRSGNEACGAAIKAVHDARTKLGTKAVAQLVVRVPVCLVDASLVTKCASICDSSVPAERAKADCDQKAGRCDGNCDGICEAMTSTKCDGTCSGTCDGPVKGSCGGRCRGTCDGRPSSGSCAGICAGTCEKGAFSGECKGTCSGECKLKAAGICDGLCAGTCSVELSDAKCAGEFKTPDVSTDCRARCELAAINHTECSTPQVGLVLAGVSVGGRETAETLKTAVDKSFPSLLKTLFEVGDKGGKRVLNAQAVIEGARKGFSEMALSGGKGTAPASEAQITKCFDEIFKTATASATAVKTSLDQAQAVRDEATK